MFFNDTYESIANRFKDWLETANESTNITDLALDYLNRAVRALMNEAPRGWDYLTIFRLEPTLSGLVLSLPTDCGVLLRVYCDTTGTGKPSVYFQREGDIQNGFRWTGSFAKATGFTGTTLTFYRAPEGTVYIDYEPVLDDFTGTGTEYSPFPADILLLQAQKIRCREKHLAKEWQIISGDYETELQKFKTKHQNPVQKFSIAINDAAGDPIVQPLIGLNRITSRRKEYSNSTDDVRY